MDKLQAQELTALANSGFLDTLRECLIEPLIEDFGDLSKPFEYGKMEVSIEYSAIAKTGAVVALKEVIASLNRLKKPKAPKKVEDYS